MFRSIAKQSVKSVESVAIEHRLVTDRQTDRQTDEQTLCAVVCLYLRPVSILCTRILDPFVDQWVDLSTVIAAMHRAGIILVVVDDSLVGGKSYTVTLLVIFVRGWTVGSNQLPVNSSSASSPRCVNLQSELEQRLLFYKYSRRLSSLLLHIHRVTMA